MALEREMATFKSSLPELLGKSDGKFALVIGDKVSGVYETYADALQEGYKSAGLNSDFLVKRITLIDGDSAHYSRPLFACRA